MFNEKGMTLIESLFSFSIFISVIILLLSFLTMTMKQEVKIGDYYLKMNQMEEGIYYTKDFSQLIAEALH